MKFLKLLPLLLLIVVPYVHAADSPQPNNKFGIHLAQPDTDNLEKAAELVNSNGGDWGYVTLVIQENDRDKQKWQSVFNQLRRIHLIPIIRIATQPEEASWRRPNTEDIEGWVHFLNSLRWVVKERYIVLFNEPNHASEWGGTVDPSTYQKIALDFAKKLKAANDNFFIMLAGFDASAPASYPTYQDEASYLSQVFTPDTIADWNKVLSGWSSHSYPNPGFVGSPYGGGRGSVRTYQWELDLLSELGVKQLPIFITETGWDGVSISRNAVAADFKAAYASVWLPDNQVKAVTPFVLDYQTEPFLRFSWKMAGSSDYFPQYYSVQEMTKTKGKPKLRESGAILYDPPLELVVNSHYQMKVAIQNTGDTFWDDKYNYRLVLNGLPQSTYFFSDVTGIEPDDTQELDLFIKTDSKPGKKSAEIALMRDNDQVLTGHLWNFQVVPLPSLDFNVSLYPRLKHKGYDFELQIFDSNERLVYKKKQVAVEHTKGSASDIQNIVLGKPYRVVILKPYYLPRQTIITFHKGSNQAVFKRMYPLDFDKDGALRFHDILALIQHPNLITLLFP